MKRACFIFVFCVLIAPLFGQSGNQFLGLSLGRGALVPEYSNVTGTTQTLSNTFALEWYRRTIGKSPWEQLYNYPDLGLQLQFQTLGNPSVNGQELSVVPFSRVHFLKHPRWDLVFQFGVGLSYVNRKYDAWKNPENVAIGSHINAHLNVQLLGTYQLTERMELMAGIAFDHLSNANLQEPNLGINSASLRVGAAMQMGENHPRTESTQPNVPKKDRFAILPSFGGKHARALDDQFYFVASFTADYHFLVRKRFFLAAGADFFYDSSTPSEMGPDKTFHQRNYFETGFHLSEALRYKHFVFALQEGVYVGLTEPVYGHVFYSRAFVEYHFPKHFFVRLAMKSHLHILEYPEFGVGFKWGSR